MRLFDRIDGEIDVTVAKHWTERFDISQLLEDRAQDLVQKLRGKIHIAVGTADQFYLDEPVRLLEQRLQPLGYEATFTYLKGWTHFSLVENGKEVDRWNLGVMTRIAQQMYAVARPGAKWQPRIAPHPASSLTEPR